MSSAPPELIRFQKPEMPPLSAFATHFAKSQETGWFSNGGPCVRELERGCASYLGLEHPGVAVNNATSGLMVALRACLGTRNGRRRLVAVPSFTFVATINAIVWAGFEPLFLDVDEDDWQPSLNSLARLEEYKEDLAGLLLCSTFGTAPSAARRARFAEVADVLSVPVVFDSAAGFGSVDETGRALGDQGWAEVFSFHATKPFAVGEGGLITSTSEAVLDDIRRLTNFGFDEHRDVSGDLGINAKMSELHGAMGLAVLETFGKVLKSRREAATWLAEELVEHGVVFQNGHKGSAFQFVPAVLPSAAARERLLAGAPRAGIELRVYFDPPMHQLRQFAGCGRVAALEVTDSIASRIVGLPMANEMTDSQLERISSLVRAHI